MDVVRALAARVGVDRTVALSLLTRGVQGAATVAMLALVVLRLTPADQGFFLTMNSLGALQVLGELGLAYALMQVVSHLPHDVPPASWRTLLRDARRRNLLTTAVSAIVVFTIGVALLGAPAAQRSATATHWLLPWSLQVAALWLYQQAFPSVALAEGRGHTEDVWRWRAEQELSAGAGTVAALLGGLGIAALAIGFTMRVIHAVVTRRRFAIASDHDTATGLTEVVAPADVWAAVHRLQWPLAATAVSSLLLLQLFGPLLFAVGGPVIAGRVGLAMVLGNGVFGVSTGWLVSRAPILGRDFAARRLDRMDADFARLLRGSVAFVGVLAAIVVSGVAFAGRLLPSLAPRLPEQSVLIPVMLAAVAQHVVFAHATRLRASGREPLLTLYVGGALVTALVMALVATHGSAASVAAAYLGLMLVGVLLATRISSRVRATWKAQRVSALSPESA